MKRMILLSLALVAAPAFAQSGGMKGMEMKAEKAAAAHKATGVVTKSDPAGGRVTIRHEPVASLGWPTMNMVFKVRDKALFDKLATDRKIEFEFTEQGRDYVVTSVK